MSSEIRLKSLTLENFRSFVDRTTITFSPNGIVQLQGDSGVGKSSINLGIAYALGFSSYPTTVLGSWGVEKHPTVKLELEANGKNIVIVRSDSFLVEVDGEQLKGSKKEKQNKLEEVLGISADALSLLTYFPQDAQASFLFKGDSEKKELLTTLLGLDKFEKAIEITQENIKKYSLNLTQLKTVHRTLENIYLNNKQDLELVELPDVKELTIKIRDQQAEQLYYTEEKQHGLEAIDLIKRLIKVSEEKTQKAIVGLQKPTSVNLLSIKKQLEELVRQDRNLESKISSELTTKRTLLDKLTKQSTLLPIMEEKYAKLQESKVFASKDTCPTCRQPWVKPADLTLEEKLIQSAKAIEQTRETIKQIPDLELDIKGLVFKPNTKIDELKQELVNSESRFLATELEIEKKKTDLTKEHLDYVLTLELPQAERALADTVETLNNTTLALNNYVAQLRYNEAVITNHESRLKTLEVQKQEVDKLQSQINELNKQINKETDFLQLIGKEGFLGVIFEEVLTEISQEANEVLHKIPNTQNISVFFDTEKENKDGNVKKSIVTNVFIAGNTLPWQTSLSGGQKSILCLAVNLALGRVLSRRCKVYPNWSIFDEVTNGADLRSKNAALEVMAQYSENSLTILVDHDILLREMVQSVIEVSINNGRSSIVMR